MKKLIAVFLISLASMSSLAQAGGGGTLSTVTTLEFQGLSCENSAGVATKPEWKSLELGDGRTLNLLNLRYDFFYLTFIFSGDVNGCHENITLKSGNDGLLALHFVKTITDCATTQKALLSVFENADLSQWGDSTVKVATKLSGEKICRDASSTVFAIFDR